MRPARAIAYVVNGQKTWTTLAQYADMIFCLVRTDPTVKKQKGISFLLIDMHSPGVTVRPLIMFDGEHEVNEVFFENVEVPAENLVGVEGEGWTYAKYLLGHERTGITGVGASKRELKRLKEIAAEPNQERRAAQRRSDLSRAACAGGDRSPCARDHAPARALGAR